MDAQSRRFLAPEFKQIVNERMKLMTAIKLRFLDERVKAIYSALLDAAWTPTLVSAGVILERTA